MVESIAVAAKEWKTMRTEIVDFLRAGQEPRIYEPGEILFSQGDPATEFYYLLSGLSLTYTIFEDGRERNILISWPDRIFGASTFFENVPRRASAIAIKRCQVLIIDRALYEECCKIFPDFQEIMIREISRDLGTLFEELADSSVLSSEIRVARFFCRRFAHGQYSGAKERPELPYTQEFIANVLGMSRMSVSKAVSNLAARGWIETNYGSICVLDRDALRLFAYG